MTKLYFPHPSNYLFRDILATLILTVLPLNGLTTMKHEITFNVVVEVNIKGIKINP